MESIGGKEGLYMYEDKVRLAIPEGECAIHDSDGYRIVERRPAGNGYLCSRNQAHLPDASAEFSVNRYRGD